MGNCPTGLYSARPRFELGPSELPSIQYNHLIRRFIQSRYSTRRYSILFQSQRFPACLMDLPSCWQPDSELLGRPCSGKLSRHLRTTALWHCKNPSFSLQTDCVSDCSLWGHQSNSSVRSWYIIRRFNNLRTSTFCCVDRLLVA